MISLTDARSGILWSAISRVTVHLFQFLTLIILARLLNPEEFGLIAASIVVIGFLNIFRDLGISAAIIQKLVISDKLVNSVYWIVMIIGIILNLFLFFSAPLIANFYNTNDLVDILKVLSFSFSITSATIVHQALFERELKFKQVARYEMIAVILGSIFGISSAYFGYGIWSLVIQMISSIVVLSFLFWIKSSFKPKMFLSFSEVKSIYKFSLNLSGFNIVNYFVRNADYILIQKFLGEQQLGFYNIAYRIMLYPLQNITAVFSRVMFPLYSKLQSDHSKFRETYISFINNIALISFPLMLWITATADLLLLTLLGEKWSSAIPLIAILAPIGMIQSIYTPAGTIFQAKGRTDIWFRWGILTGMIFITAYAIGLKWGIIGVAIGYLAANLIAIYPGLRISFKLIDMSVTDFIFSLGKTFLISFSMFLLIFLIKIFLSNYMGRVELLIVLIIVALLFYIPASLKFNRQKINEFLAIIKG